MTATKFSLGVVAASVLVLITACGGGGDSAPVAPPVTPPPVVDTQAPTVLADQVVPAVGSTVARRALKTTLPFSETLNCFTGEQTFEDKGITGKAVCQDKVVTLTFDDTPLANKSSVTATLSNLTDLAGNKMVPFTWTYQLQADLASVTLSATPDTIVAGAGTQVTLNWTTTNAVNCLASGGWNGSLTPPAGGSQTVTPTVTTTYSAVCYNSANIATAVVSTTVTVTPKSVVTYPPAVVVFGPNWVYRVDPTVSGGVVPIANRSGHDFYAYGFRATALPNCDIQVSGLDSYTFQPFQFFWDRKKEEFTLDTTGTAPPRLMGNYTFAVLPDPAFPDTVINTVVGDKRFYVLNTDHQSLWYQNGTAPAVFLGTFPLGIKAVIAYPACTVQ